MTELSGQGNIKNKWKWIIHLFRYFTASLITWVSISIPPLIGLIIFFGLSGLAILGSWISFLFLGAEIEEGLQIVFWFIAAPFMLILTSVAAFFAIIFLAGAVTVIFVLPVSYLGEVITEKVFLPSFFSRILGVFMTSFFIGAITGIISWFFFRESSKTIQFLWILISFSSSSFIFSLFGTITTLINTVSNHIIKKS